jgi:hypothetical protein
MSLFVKRILFSLVVIAGLALLRYTSPTFGVWLWELLANLSLGVAIAMTADVVFKE